MQYGMIKGLDCSMVMNMEEWLLLTSPGYVVIVYIHVCVLCLDVCVMCVGLPAGSEVRSLQLF